eukprot:Hpha_TRINITY_DN15783_c3_g6::TRINITY_DN15783_c3_g6_i1::g.38239::m.38239
MHLSNGRGKSQKPLSRFFCESLLPPYRTLHAQGEIAFSSLVSFVSERFKIDLPPEWGGAGGGLSFKPIFVLKSFLQHQSSGHHWASERKPRPRAPHAPPPPPPPYPPPAHAPAPRGVRGGKKKKRRAVDPTGILPVDGPPPPGTLPQFHAASKPSPLTDTIHPPGALVHQRVAGKSNSKGDIAVVKLRSNSKGELPARRNSGEGSAYLDTFSARMVRGSPSGLSKPVSSESTEWRPREAMLSPASPGCLSRVANSSAPRAVSSFADLSDLPPLPPSGEMIESPVQSPGRVAMQKGLRILQAPIRMLKRVAMRNPGEADSNFSSNGRSVPDIDGPLRPPPSGKGRRLRAQTYAVAAGGSDGDGLLSPSPNQSPNGWFTKKPSDDGRGGRTSRVSVADVDVQPRSPLSPHSPRASIARHRSSISVPGKRDSPQESSFDREAAALPENPSTSIGFTSSASSPNIGLRRSNMGSLRILTAFKHVRAARKQSRVSLTSCDNESVEEEEESEEWSEVSEELDLVPTSPKLSAQQLKDEEYIRHFHRFDRYWIRVVFAYTIYNLLVVPARIGLEAPAAKLWFYLDLVLDGIFIMEICLRFFRPFSVGGLVCCDLKKIRIRYLKGAFIFDLLQALPLEIVSYARDGGTMVTPWLGREGSSHPAWRANRLLLARHVDKDFATAFAETLNTAPHFARIVKTFFLFVMITHYVACAFLAIHFMEGQEVTRNWTMMNYLYEQQTLSGQYFLAYDYSMKSMVGMGRPGRIVPYTDLETWYCICVVLMGVAIFALVLATISNLVGETVSESEKLREKINEIYDALNYISHSRERPLPKEYTAEVIGYYRHVFQVSRVILGRLDEITQDMLPATKFRLSNFVGAETMKRVPMFAEAISSDKQGTHFLHFMLTKLEPQVFCESEIVMRKGDAGDSMYFLLHGRMGVIIEAQPPDIRMSRKGSFQIGGKASHLARAVMLSDKSSKVTPDVPKEDPKGEKVVFVLTKGSFLGEIALLYACRRTATIKALSHCSTFMLTRAVFEEAEILFPEAIEKVRSASRGRLQKIKLEEIVKKVPLFATCKEDPDFVEEVVAILEPLGVPEGTYVVKRGERGKEMFFISQGELAVEVGGQCVHTMREGDFFGEIVLFYDTCRTASIVAQTYCDLFVLPADTFRQVMAKYPQQRKGIEDMARRRFQTLVYDDLVKKMPAFAPLRDQKEFLQEVAAQLEPRSYEANQVVCEKGDDMSALILVSKGALIFDPDRGSERKQLEEGNHFGEMALLESHVPFSHFCKVVAEDYAEIYVLAASRFFQLVSMYPEECKLLQKCAGDGLKRVVFDILNGVTPNGLRRRYYSRLDEFALQGRLQLMNMIKSLQEQDEAEEDAFQEREKTGGPSKSRKAKRASVAGGLDEGSPGGKRKRSFRSGKRRASLAVETGPGRRRLSPANGAPLSPASGQVTPVGSPSGMSASHG